MARHHAEIVGYNICGGRGSLGVGNGPQTIAASIIRDNWHSIQGYFYKFLMGVRITVMVTKKDNVEEGYGNKFWESMALSGC